MSDKLAILTADRFHSSDAKTAHGVIRYGTREVVAVIDELHAGRMTDAVVGFVGRSLPIVRTVREAQQSGADVLLVGIAPLGGKLDAGWRAIVLEAIEAGMHIECGLHTPLNEDPELAAAARARRVELRDLRVFPGELEMPEGPARRPAVCVVHTVGSDCAIGKMSVTLELDREARRRGLESVFVPTGQTGIAIAGWGIAVDHAICDFLAGAAERLVRDGAGRGSLLWVEGQGSILHPAYSGVTLGLLHGSLPDLLILCHRAGAQWIDDYPETPIPALAELVQIYETMAALVRPASVVAIALNTSALGAAEARAAITEVEADSGLPCEDVVRFGAGRLLDEVLASQAVASLRPVNPSPTA